LTRWQ